MLIDVRRAHFYSPARRKVFVELPAEARFGDGKVGRLLRSMYGCRDDHVNWELSICEAMVAIGFVQGRASPCIHRHLERQLHVWVHGDDFAPLGYIVNVRWFFAKLQEFWVVTNRGILGPSGYHDRLQSIRVLGRLVEWIVEGGAWEADPRHAEFIRKSFGVTGRSVSPLGVIDKFDDIEGEAPIGKESADRSNTLRAKYLSSDKPEMQVWELARKLQQPPNLDVMGLKRLARFLGVRPRLIGLFKWQRHVTRIGAWCGTDHAGCIRIRKSVPVRTNWKGQGVIGLSSGEAEYNGLVSAASQTFGLQSILFDWG